MQSVVQGNLTKSRNSVVRLQERATLRMVHESCCSTVHLIMIARGNPRMSDKDASRTGSNMAGQRGEGPRRRQREQLSEVVERSSVIRSMASELLGSGRACSCWANPRARSLWRHNQKLPVIPQLTTPPLLDACWPGVAPTGPVCDC